MLKSLWTLQTHLLNNQKRHVLGNSKRKGCVLSPEGDRSTSRIIFLVQDPSSLNLSATYKSKLTYHRKTSLLQGRHWPAKFVDVDTVVQMRQNTHYEFFVLSAELPATPGTTAKNRVKNTRYRNKQTLQSRFGSQLYMLSHAIFLLVITKLLITNTTEYTYITLQALYLQYSGSVSKIFMFLVCFNNSRGMSCSPPLTYSRLPT
jgi:hypothetical protein